MEYFIYFVSMDRIMCQHIGMNLQFPRKFNEVFYGGRNTSYENVMSFDTEEEAYSNIMPQWLVFEPVFIGTMSEIETLREIKDL